MNPLFIGLALFIVACLLAVSDELDRMEAEDQ
jgi:hypothetical protein